MKLKKIKGITFFDNGKKFFMDDRTPLVVRTENGGGKTTLSICNEKLNIMYLIDVKDIKDMMQMN